MSPFRDPPFDPDHAPLCGDERAVSCWLLDYHRHVLLRKLDGISEEQSRHTVAASDLTLLGLARHLALVEQYWFAQLFLGLDVVDHWHDPDDRDRDFHVQDGDRLDEAVAVLRAEIDHARRVTAAASFDATAVRQRHGEDVNLRWIVVHMIEEYARHCGHADLLREAIDGVTGD